MDTKKIIGGENYAKLEKLRNDNVVRFVEKYVAHCAPSSVFVSDGSPEDLKIIRERALSLGEESALAVAGQTSHFDNYGDQSRDNKNTKILVPAWIDLGSTINTMGMEEGLAEVHGILKDIMKGKEMIVSFFCLGTVGSSFSLLCLQITDSYYVSHSENILYRPGYDEFMKAGGNKPFFRFVHSAGVLDENKTSKNLDKRRVYIDFVGDTVFSANTQYGGNTIGLKKLAMRLAINKAVSEGWLTEHMLVMGIKTGGKTTYVTGAFPSLCGKTSTAMLEGETIVGDDIAYLRKIKGRVRAVNAECGMFGIIQGINSKDDPIQWKILNSPGETIVSNILITDKKEISWIGHDEPTPEKGWNYSGEWFIGKKDSAGKEILSSHPNARFTVSLERLPNADENLHNPDGVEVGGIIYGGRDSDTSVPVEESFGWEHGVITKGASLESETTAAALGKEGVRVFNPMSNLEFLSVMVGKYISAHLAFGSGLFKEPLIFGVNYFLKDGDGNFLNEKNDKKVWLKWIAKRIMGEVSALKRPTGLIPVYEDLKILFAEVASRVYSKENYEQQFMLRTVKNIQKIDRILEVYSILKEIPERLSEVLNEQKERLEKAYKKFGDNISPFTEIPF